jgi:hypothetical protein
MNIEKFRETVCALRGAQPFAQRVATRIIARLVVAMILPVSIGSSLAATCPFDNGGSDAINDGVVLTRYALGITGTPLVASTRYASLDPLQVKNNIECVGCALDMNGDGAIDTIDTTIIARHLAGFTGMRLTQGLALGSGSRPDAASVQSFLANGCAVGGAVNAWTLGGNAFGVPGVLATTDAQPLTLRSGGSSLNAVIAGNSGLRIVDSGVASAPIVINGSVDNQVAAGARGATIAGGGITQGNDPNYGAAQRNRVTDAYGTVGGGWGNRAGADGATVTLAVGATVAGGLGNTAGGPGSAITGGSANNASGVYSAIGGGLNNAATGNVAGVLSGDGNRASGQNSSVVGGKNNFASGTFSVVVGGGGNTASAHGSFIGGGGYCCQGTETSNFPNTVTGRGGAIVGGYENSVAGAASFIGGGYLNRITGTQNDAYSVAISGGNGNTATGNTSTIGGGFYNTVSANNATVAGGAGNSATAEYSSVSGGYAANARLHGQTANAAGSFSSTPGTAQATQYVLRNRTTDANQNWLFLDGSSAVLLFEPGRAGLMDVQVVASAEGTGFSASYSFKCHYSVVIGGAAIQPTGCNKAVVYEAEASWDANIAFHPGGSGFGISVIGAAGRNIRWVATVRATEVSLQ